jgi:hypothetical protein
MRRRMGQSATPEAEGAHWQWDFAAMVGGVPASVALIQCEALFFTRDRKCREARKQFAVVCF